MFCFLSKKIGRFFWALHTSQMSISFTEMLMAALTTYHIGVTLDKIGTVFCQQ